MTEQEYKQYLNESYGEDFHFYENVYNEGAIWNGIKNGVRNFFSTVRQNGQAARNQKNNDNAQAATLKAAGASPEDNLQGELAAMAQDISKVCKQIQTNTFKQNKQNLKASQDKNLNDKNTKTQGTLNDSTLLVNYFISHYQEAAFNTSSLLPDLKKYNLLTADPNTIVSTLLNVGKKNPDELKDFVNKFYSNFKSNNGPRVLTAVQNYKASVANNGKEDQDNTQNPVDGVDQNNKPNTEDTTAAGEQVENGKVAGEDKSITESDIQAEDEAEKATGVNSDTVSAFLTAAAKRGDENNREILASAADIIQKRGKWKAQKASATKNVQPQAPAQ